MTTTETTTETFIERVDVDDFDEEWDMHRALGEFLTEPREGLFAVDVARLDSANAPPGVDAHEAQYKNALLYTVQRYSEDKFVTEIGTALARRGLTFPDAALRYIYANYNNCAWETVTDIDIILGDFAFFPDVASLREFCADAPALSFLDLIGLDDWQRSALKELLDEDDFDPTHEIKEVEYSEGNYLSTIGGGFLVQAEPDYYDDAYAVETFTSRFSPYNRTSFNSIEGVATRAALRLKSPTMISLYQGAGIVWR